MDDERKAWEKQFASNFGARELLRFMAAFIGCLILGIVVAILTRSQWAYWPFFILALVFPIVGRVWAPGYRVLRFILGNPNLPEKLLPRSTVKAPRKPLPWYAFLPGIWFWILTLALLYFAVRYFLR